jgi:hypothetical protein
MKIQLMWAVFTAFIMSFGQHLCANEQWCIRGVKSWVVIDGSYKPVGMNDFCFDNNLFKVGHQSIGSVVKVAIYKVNDKTFNREEVIHSDSMVISNLVSELKPEIERCSATSGESIWRVDLIGTVPLALEHQFTAYGFPGSCDRVDTIFWNQQKLYFDFYI